MGALVEFFAGLIVAIAASAFAHFGVDLDAAGRSQAPPSVQRTALATDGPQSSENVDCVEDCDEEDALEAA